jgi:hypothetical protein
MTDSFLLTLEPMPSVRVGRIAAQVGVSLERVSKCVQLSGVAREGNGREGGLAESRLALQKRQHGLCRHLTGASVTRREVELRIDRPIVLPQWASTSSRTTGRTGRGPGGYRAFRTSPVSHYGLIANSSGYSRRVPERQTPG